MSLSTKTSDQLTRQRRGLFMTILMKTYFQRQPVFNKQLVLQALLDYLFLMPTTIKIVHKTMFMNQEALQTYQHDRLHKIVHRLQQGSTYENHQNLSELLEPFGQMKEKQYNSLPWLLR